MADRKVTDRVNDMNKQRGFGLIEVLISMLVFAVGAVALVKLQGELVRGGSNANARSVALSIAQEKLDDLRAFQCTQKDSTAGAPCFKADAAATDTRPVLFTEIANNLGGLIDAGNITRGAATYALSWTIQPQEVVYKAGAFALGDTTTVKRVRVTVNWKDPDGTAQTVTLEDQINNKPPAHVALAMEKQGGQPIEGLDIPDATAKDKLGVDVGGGSAQKTTDPQMFITQNDQFVETEIETVTYAGDANPTATRREATLIINCECKQAGNGPGAEPSRDELIIDGTGTVKGHITQTGAIVKNKPTGTRINTGQAGQQSQLCNECCNDHHDHLPTGPTENQANWAKVYDPWRPKGNDANGNPFYLDNDDHSHFYPVSTSCNPATDPECVSTNPPKNTKGTKTVLQPRNSTGDTYLEACRLQRVGGVFRVMQDWHLATIKVMPECFLEGGCPLGSGVVGAPAFYLDYVEQFIKDYVDLLDSTDPAAIPTVNTVFSNEPNEVKMIPAQDLQMVARAVYIDFLTPDEITKLKKMNSAAEGFLGLVPFEQVNMTKLASWAVKDSAGVKTNQAAVTSEAVENDGKYSRGKVTANNGEPFVHANLQLSNTGFLGFDVYNTKLTVDTDDATEAFDKLQLKIGGLAAGENKVNVSFVGLVEPDLASHLGSQFQQPDPLDPLTGTPITCSGACSLDALGNGEIQVVNYNAAGENRMVCFVTDIPLANRVVAMTGDGSDNEMTTFTLIGAKGEFTLIVDIVRQELQAQAEAGGFTCVP